MKHALPYLLMLSFAVWMNIIMIEKLENRPTTFAQTTARYEP